MNDLFKDFNFGCGVLVAGLLAFLYGAVAVTVYRFAPGIGGWMGDIGMMALLIGLATAVPYLFWWMANN